MTHVFLYFLLKPQLNFLHIISKDLDLTTKVCQKVLSFILFPVFQVTNAGKGGVLSLYQLLCIEFNGVHVILPFPIESAEDIESVFVQ
jgi:hypothetical protein